MKPEERIRDYDQPGWNAGYREGQQERAELEAENARLQGIVDRASRYVLKPDTLLEVARRGNEVFGKRWMEITGFKPTPAKDAT